MPHRYCQCQFSNIIYPYGGEGGNRTHVHNAFTTKELQQFFTDYLLQDNLLILLEHTIVLLRKLVILSFPFQLYPFTALPSILGLP
jgi:hypothetical protein